MICRLVDISRNKMSTFFHIAYGSNLHPVRLKKKAPSAKLLGKTYVEGRKLLFRKRSSDGSAKCDMAKGDSSKDVVHVALFEIAYSDKLKLDNAEGLEKGYHEEQIDVVVNDSQLTGFAYVADDYTPDLSPYDWYRELVLLGALYHRFPDEYIRCIQAVPSIPDEDKARSEENWALVEELRDVNNSSRLVR